MSLAASYLTLFFSFNDTPTTAIYTLSLHDALPIFQAVPALRWTAAAGGARARDRQPSGGPAARRAAGRPGRSEEHTSELQSRLQLVCRLLLEKKNHSNYFRSVLNQPVIDLLLVNQH